MATNIEKINFNSESVNVENAINFKNLSKVAQAVSFSDIEKYLDDMYHILKGLCIEVNSIWNESGKDAEITTSYINEKGDKRSDIPYTVVIEKVETLFERVSKNLAYRKLLHNGDKMYSGVEVMRRLIEMPTFDIAKCKVSTRKSEVDDSTITTLGVKKIKRNIEIFDFDKFSASNGCKTSDERDGIGYTRKWVELLDTLNVDFTVSTHVALFGEARVASMASEIYDNYKFRNKIAEVCKAKKTEYGKGEDYEANPCSNSSLKKTITAIIEAMVGADYGDSWAKRKFKAIDFSLLKEGYATASKDKRGLKCPKVRDMAARVVGMMTNIYEGVDPRIEYAKIKK